MDEICFALTLPFIYCVSSIPTCAGFCPSTAVGCFYAGNKKNIGFTLRDSLQIAPGNLKVHCEIASDCQTRLAHRTCGTGEPPKWVPFAPTFLKSPILSVPFPNNPGNLQTTPRENRVHTPYVPSVQWYTSLGVLVRGRAWSEICAGYKLGIKDWVDRLAPTQGFF